MTRHRGVLPAAALMSAVVLASCGGDEGPDDPADADVAVEAEEAAAEVDEADAPAEDAEAEPADAEGDAGGSSGEGRATVVLDDGTAYEYSTTAPATYENAYTYCSSVVGSLQAFMYLVDESGDTTEDAHLDIILLEPGGDYERSGDPAELEVGLGLDDRGIPQTYQGVEIDATASGNTASGTFTAVDDFSGAEITGTIEAKCS